VFPVQKPNDLWTVDFKGWWTAQNGEHCEPLTVRDAYSRFVLAIVVLPGVHLKPVRDVFEQLFSKYGLPRAIQTDNGNPFVAGRGQLGLTQLSAWWLRLGIEHVRSRPGTPSDNGGHERLHRDVAAEVEAFAALDRRRQQTECDRWRHDFNHHRGHEALKMKVSAQIYVRSPRRYSTPEDPLVYRAPLIARKVSNTGIISHRRRIVFVSSALRGEFVALRYRRAGDYELWYAAKQLGVVDFSGPRPMLRPTTWNTRKVLPTL
jgi:transposase InsO family protein